MAINKITAKSIKDAEIVAADIAPLVTCDVKTSGFKPCDILDTPLRSSLIWSRYLTISNANGCICGVGNGVIALGDLILTIPPGLEVNKSSNSTCPASTPYLALFVRYMLSSKFLTIVDLINCISITVSATDIP